MTFAPRCEVAYHDLHDQMEDCRLSVEIRDGQERSAELRAIKAQYPTAVYYRHISALSGPKRAHRFGAPVPKAMESGAR